MKFIFTLSLSFITFSLAAQLTEKIETDRPDQTECPYTVPHHWIQAEMGIVKEKPGTKISHWSIPSVLWKYGISEKMELRVITEYSSYTFDNKYKDTIGFHPVHIGFKLQLWEEKGWLPKTSIIAQAGFNRLASKDFRSLSFLAPNFRFTMQNTFTEEISLGYNIGAEWDDTKSNAVFAYTFAPGFSLSEQWYAYVEAFGFIQKGEAAQHNIDGGFAYNSSSNVKLDLSGGIGISKESPAWYVNLGCSFRFALKRKTNKE